jgi:fructokinase
MENPEKPASVGIPIAVQVATAGEALIDLIGRPDGLFDPCLGGSVFNFTRAMARQGVSTLYLNPLSSDRFGRRLAQRLVDDGVHLSHPQPVAEITSLAVVGLTPEGHPDYAFYRQGVADRAVCAQSLQADCAAHPSIEIVCSGCLALAPDDAAKYIPFLQASRDAGKTVVVDANLRPSVMPDLSAYRANVWAALRTARIVKVSDEDLQHLAVPGDTVLAQAQHVLAASGAHLLALTLGAQGAMLLTPKGQIWYAKEPAPVAVVDTVGAGDCFLAGLVAAGLRGRLGFLKAGAAALSDEDARSMLAHALASATLCVMRRGCEPPTFEEVVGRLVGSPVVFG